MTIMMRPLQSPLAEKKEAVDYAAVYVESTTPKCTPTKKRITMIAREMNKILERAQDYLLRHMIDDDLSDEAKSAAQKAAMELAYLHHHYDTLENKVVYYPTCTDLILKQTFLKEAEKFYYREQDEFPPEYSSAIKSAARVIERKRKIADYEKMVHIYEDDESESFEELTSPSMHVRLDSDMVNKFAGSWRDTMSIPSLDDDIDDESSFTEANDDE